MKMPASKLRKVPTYYSFGDLLILPNPSQVEPNQASVASRFSRGIPLSVPISSSPMDTVTDSRMALEMARLGSIGVIHRNMSSAREVEEVTKVKSAKAQGGTVDDAGRPRVAAAVGPFDADRARALEKAGADAIVIDTAHGHNFNVVKSAKALRKQLSCDLIVGNIGTGEAAEDYLEAKPDAFRVGLGSGSVCITRTVTGVGVPQASAVHGVWAVARKRDIPVISDGGVESGGDVVKALALGADCVMLGKFLAGCDETPGALLDSPLPGLHGKYKLIRGMGAKSVIGRLDRYITSSKGAAEGVEGLVPSAGPVALVLERTVQQLKQGMGYVGARDIRDLHKKAKFIAVTQSGVDEGKARLPVIIDAETWSKLGGA